METKDSGNPLLFENIIKMERNSIRNLNYINVDKLQSKIYMVKEFEKPCMKIISLKHIDENAKEIL